MRLTASSAKLKVLCWRVVTLVLCRERASLLRQVLASVHRRCGMCCSRACIIAAAAASGRLDRVACLWFRDCRCKLPGLACGDDSPRLPLGCGLWSPELATCMSVLVSPQSQPDNVCWWSEVKIPLVRNEQDCSVIVMMILIGNLSLGISIIKTF